MKADQEVTDLMHTKVYGYVSEITYYLNVWNRNVVARAIDVRNDQNLKTIDPETEVESDSDTSRMTVAVRLEHRKIRLNDALDIVKAIKDLMVEAPTDEEFEAKFLSEEALKVADDMLPKNTVAGDACILPDGSAGVWADKDGDLVCVSTAPLSEEEKQNAAADVTAASDNVTDATAPKEEGGLADGEAPEAAAAV